MPTTTPDPFLVLGVPEDADDAAVRRAYLDLVRRYPPETHARQFQAIADAYEAIKSAELRAARLFFGAVPRPGEPLRGLVPGTPNDRHRIGVDRWLDLLAEARRGLH